MGYREIILAEPGLVAYWRLGDSGSSAADASGNGHTGTLVSGITTGVAGALNGDADTAMSVDGVIGSRITAGALGAFSAWTMECWVKPNGASQNANGALMSDVYSTAVEYALTFHGTGLGNSDSDLMVRAGVYDNVWHTSPAITLTDAVWQHVVATWDGSLILLYLSASPTAPLSYSHAPFSNNLGFRIGTSWDTSQPNSWKGGLDEVAFYSSALSQAQVTAHYQAGITAPGPSSAPASVDSREPAGAASSAEPRGAADSLESLFKFNTEVRGR